MFSIHIKAEPGKTTAEEENQPKYKKTEAQENAELDVPHGQEVDQKGQEESLLNSHDTNNVTAEVDNAGEDSVDENSLFVQCCADCFVEFVTLCLSSQH